jgi:hypothetical protein
LDSVVEFLELLWQTVLLGLAAAFTPSLLALQILIVSGDPWRRRSFAVAVGGASAFGVVGALLFLGFAQLPTESTGDHGAADALLRLVAGGALLAGAVFLFRPHPVLRERMERDINGYVARASSWVFLGVAFALSIKDLSSFIVLAPALHDIAVADLNMAEQGVLLVVLYALALSPVLVPPLLRTVLGHRADAIFGRAYRFTMGHQFQLVGSMAVVIGAYLILTGVLRLA